MVKGPEYAMSFACFKCQKSFKRQYDAIPKDYPKELPCPECKGSAINLGRNFKPPKKADNKQWVKVKYLVDHGFMFQKIRTGVHSHDTVPYPSTLKEAKAFVIKYKEYAIK